MPNNYRISLFRLIKNLHIEDDNSSNMFIHLNQQNNNIYMNVNFCKQCGNIKSYERTIYHIEKYPNVKHSYRIWCDCGQRLELNLEN